MPLWFAGI